MAGKARVNAIRGPKCRRLEDGVGRKNSVEGDEGGCEFAGEFANHMDFWIDVLSPSLAVQRAWQNKRFAKNDPDSLIPRALQDVPAVFFKNLCRSRIIAIVSAPAVVDADEDRDPIRLEVETVLLPPSDEIHRTGAGDPLVDELEAEVRVARLEQGSGHHRIASPQRIGVFTVAAGIGDAVALKENFLTGLE